MPAQFRLSWLFSLAIAIIAVSAASPTRADVKEAAKKLLAATVVVEVESKASDSRAEVGLPPKSAAQTAFASGTVVSPDGLVVTLDLSHDPNAVYHVKFRGGKVLPGKVLVADRRSGLTLLKVDAQDLTHLELAEEPAEVGQKVLTVSWPQSKHVRYVQKSDLRFLAMGIIAATERRVESIGVPLLQTDVRAGMGSAGAPLTDEQGRILGIILGVEGADPAQGVTFAVPARYVADLMEARRGQNTVVIHAAYLGVQLGSADDGDGVQVTEVFEDTPAAKAGVKEGDVITAVDGEQVAAAEELSSHIGQRTAGAKVTLTVQRDGEEQQVEVTLGRREATPADRRSRVAWVDLAKPGEYRVVPLRTAEGMLDPQVIEKYEALIVGQTQQRQQADPQEPKHEANSRNGVEDVRILRLTDDLTPLTLSIQRPEADQRLDQLTEEVKSLREDVKNLTQQLQSLVEKLEDK